jgi:hypothetical protein
MRIKKERAIRLIAKSNEMNNGRIDLPQPNESVMIWTGAKVYCREMGCCNRYSIIGYAHNDSDMWNALEALR